MDDEEKDNQYLVKTKTTTKKIYDWVNKSNPKTVKRDKTLYNMVICQLYTSFKAYIPEQLYSECCTKPTKKILHEYKKTLKIKKEKYTSKS